MKKKTGGPWKKGERVRIIASPDSNRSRVWAGKTGYIHHDDTSTPPVVVDGVRIGLDLANWSYIHDSGLVRIRMKETARQRKRRIASEKAQAKRDAVAKAAADVKAAKAVADRVAALANLPTPARVFLSYLDANPSAFGCQRTHVIATVGALLGVDFSKLA